jgi:hypothetical protein
MSIGRLRACDQHTNPEHHRYSAIASLPGPALDFYAMFLPEVTELGVRGERSANLSSRSANRKSSPCCWAALSPSTIRCIGKWTTSRSPTPRSSSARTPISWGACRTLPQGASACGPRCDKELWRRGEDSLELSGRGRGYRRHRAAGRKLYQSPIVRRRSRAA